MKNYIEKKKEVILLNSISNNFKEALNEWVVSEDFEIAEIQQEETCEICSKPNLRYLYWIKNNKNNKKILLGSTCICFFVKQDMKILYIDPFTLEQREFSSCSEVNNLRQRDALKKTTEYYKKSLEKGGDPKWLNIALENLRKIEIGKKITPRIAGVIIRNIKEISFENIEKGRDFFNNIEKEKNKLRGVASLAMFGKIELKKEDKKNDLTDLLESKEKTISYNIWLAMTPAQRKKYKKPNEVKEYHE